MIITLLCMLGLATAAPPDRLDATTFDAVRAYVQPTAQDRLYQSLDWNRSVYEGLIEGRAQDRPLLLWMYFGDPQGQC